MSLESRSLGETFLASANSYPDRLALFVDGKHYTYQALLEKALALAVLLCRTDAGEVPLCALYARRSLWAYAGILGILLAGRGYVPLQPAFPVDRTQRMLDLSGTSTLIADQKSLEALGKVLMEIPRPLTVILPDHAQPPAWATACPHHQFLPAGALTQYGQSFTPQPVAADAIAYLLFTSGTTGIPKGIGIQQQNVMAYVHAMSERYSIEPEDRLSQAFELTFDPSVHDLFVCWSGGACLYVPPQRVAMAPASFIREHHLTSWYSTPATAAMMLQLRMLCPGAFPSLRWSLFSGEALPMQLAAAWQQAAPHATLENLYGPTEATVNCTVYTYSPTTSPAESVHGIVPIGQPFGQTHIAVVNEQGVPVGENELGELLLSGGQLAPGYWRDPTRTAISFGSYPTLSPSGPWYRTGDLVTINSNSSIVYHGRIDDQIKIRGHRVELQEIEGVIRNISGVDGVVALGWPNTPAGADGIIVFLTTTRVSNETILAVCKHRLPHYMIPQEIHHIQSLPLSASGKIDRVALLKRKQSLC